MKDNVLVNTTTKMFLNCFVLPGTISVHCNTENVIYLIIFNNKGYWQYAGKTMTKNLIVDLTGKEVDLNIHNNDAVVAS